jgi:hypothetical protein
MTPTQTLRPAERRAIPGTTDWGPVLVDDDGCEVEVGIDPGVSDPFEVRDFVFPAHRPWPVAPSGGFLGAPGLSLWDQKICSAGRESFLRAGSSLAAGLRQAEEHIHSWVAPESFP